MPAMQAPVEAVLVPNQDSGRRLFDGPDFVEARLAEEAEYGPALGRSPIVRGNGEWSTDDEIRHTIDELVRRLQRDLIDAAGPKPPCNFAHEATSPTCPDPACQEWCERVLAWHARRFGQAH